MFSAIADGFKFLFGLMGDAALFILSGIAALFRPIFDLIGAIFYLLYMLGLVLVKVLILFGAVVKMLIGILAGLFKTITGLAYTGSDAALPASYQGAFSNLQPVFANLQFDKVGYVLIVTIWIFTAFTAARIIGKNGGGSD